VPDEGYSLEALAGDVIRVCDDVGLGRAVFCGHSMPVALKVVVKRPDLAAGLVMLDGTVLLPASERARLTGFWSQVLATDGWRDA
jgi:pimeloyl-ACP methyl ester carboxylesterase